MTASQPTPESSGSEDLRLVRKVLAGEAAAVEDFVRRMGCVMRILKGLNRGPGGPLTAPDIEDLGQEVLTVLWRKLPQFDGRSKLEAWTYRFCQLEYLKELRRRRMRRMQSLEGAEIGQPAHQASTLETKEELERVWSALTQLQPIDAQAIRLRRIEGQSFEKAAEDLGIPEATLKSRYYRGIRELRRRLAERDHKDMRGEA